MKYDHFIDMCMFYDDLFEFEGPITDLDIKHNTIAIDGEYFILTESAYKQALRRIGVTGTIKDFTDKHGNVDYEFVQKAIDRKLEFASPIDAKILTDAKKSYMVMSPRYERTKHEVVLNKLNNIVDVERYFDEKRSNVTDKYMHLFLKGINEFEIDGDSNYLFGVSVRNSQTGWSALGISQFIERLVCSNGMTSRLVSMSISLTHRGGATREFGRIADSYLKPEPVVALLTKAIKKPPLLESPKNMPRLLGKFGIKKEHHEGIVNAWEQERELGLGPFGIANAITRYNDHTYINTPGYNMDDYYAMSVVAMEMLSY